MASLTDSFALWKDTNDAFSPASSSLRSVFGRLKAMAFVWMLTSMPRSTPWAMRLSSSRSGGLHR